MQLQDAASIVYAGYGYVPQQEEERSPCDYCNEPLDETTRTVNLDGDECRWVHERCFKDFKANGYWEKN